MAADIGDGKGKRLPYSFFYLSRFILISLFYAYYARDPLLLDYALRFLQQPKSSDSRIDFLAGHDDTSDTA